ncbi:RCC1 domain-containing protein 1 isoform X2 [Cephus cinctus]|uniref:RCC1 domain-containing protein 1 isoform X2 n=1 Tax=Cephus cinctus TaxID=211228 RepID=A0AAJ7BGV9_CEPCN|nr:RCC1 domain-containing protein 1 isoform X2 [Cephus cinctus]
MTLYYAGFNGSPMFSHGDTVITITEKFTKITFQGITGLEIGWNYFLLWRDTNLYITEMASGDDSSTKKELQLLEIPEDSSWCKRAVAGKEYVVILSSRNDVWRYNIYERLWRKVQNFIPTNEDSEPEYTIEISHGGSTVVALTNLGRIFNIPMLANVPKRVKFVDVACGFDHTILLTDNGEIYSMGMGTRGQLGHGDLEDCDNPKIIEALAGLKVVQISAAGWHSAVVTDQGDLYTWGWNTIGELGIDTEDTKIFATPTIVDFKDGLGEILDSTVKKVQCGNVFTICLLDNGSLWGAGSNKYGQLGQSRNELISSKIFVKLKIDFDEKSVRDIKCHEWGSLVSTD